MGKNGQVGWELQRALAPLGELIALDRHGSPEYCGDLSDLDGLSATIRKIEPAVIVNAAAYTAVDHAEEHRELATRINNQAVERIAQEASAMGALLVHYSTDYVFNGDNSQLWTECDKPDPLSHYGASKLAGEQAIQNSTCPHLIFRTSWVYASRGQNFIATMHRLFQEKSGLQIVSDQIGTPTSAELIADITARAIPQALEDVALSGVYHLAAKGETSWHGYAAHIANWLQNHGIALKTQPKHINAITTEEYPTPATRPLNSRLNTQKLQAAFGVTLPAWQTGVERALTERILDHS